MKTQTRDRTQQWQQQQNHSTEILKQKYKKQKPQQKPGDGN